MKPHLDFERFDPPPIHENMLRAALQKRQERRQTVLLAIAGILCQFVLLFCGFLAAEAFPMAALLCICSVIISTAGSGVIAIVFTQIRRSML